jgi:hypothetical protein
MCKRGERRNHQVMRPIEGHWITLRCNAFHRLGVYTASRRRAFYLRGVNGETNKVF